MAPVRTWLSGVGCWARRRVWSIHPIWAWPMANVQAPGSSAKAAISRPLILNRPFRSVAELGGVFSDTPWKNLNFSEPESGAAALLDTFCINEDYRRDALAAGYVDLNSKQPPVFQALISGAYRDDSGTPVAVSATDAITLSQALVRRTTVGGTTASTTGTPQPLMNIADLVGRWTRVITKRPHRSMELPPTTASVTISFTTRMAQCPTIMSFRLIAKPPCEPCRCRASGNLEPDD